MAHIRDLPKVAGLVRGDTGLQYVVLPFDTFKRFIRKIALEGAIDEKAYLKKYPDVERAIADGKFKTATEHYLLSGYSEQRLAVALKDAPSEKAPEKAPDKPAGKG